MACEKGDICHRCREGTFYVAGVSTGSGEDGEWWRRMVLRCCNPNCKYRPYEDLVEQLG